MQRIRMLIAVIALVFAPTLGGLSAAFGALPVHSHGTKNLHDHEALVDHDQSSGDQHSAHHDHPALCDQCHVAFVALPITPITPSLLRPSIGVAFEIAAQQINLVFSQFRPPKAL